MSGLCILLRARSRETSEGLAHALRAAPGVDRVEILDGERTLEAALAEDGFDVLCYELGTNPRAELDRLERLAEPRPALILAGSGEDPTLLVRAMRLRPEAFLVDGRFDDLDGALERVAAARRAPRGAHGVIALSGAKGGVGTSLLACELAGALARLGERTCLVDLDPHGGDVALYLDLCPLHTLADLARKGDALDADFLRSVVTLHENGPFVIAAPHEMEEAALLEPRTLERVLALLRREFDWVVLDVPGAWDEGAVRALDLADLVILVSSLDVASLTHASARRRLLLRLGAPEDRVRAAVQQSGSPLAPADVARALGRAPDLAIAFEPAVAQAACNRGVSVHELAPGGPLDRASAALAASVHAWLGVAEPAQGAAAPPAAGIASRLVHLRRSLRGLRHAAPR